MASVMRWVGLTIEADFVDLEKFIRVIEGILGTLDVNELNGATRGRLDLAGDNNLNAQQM